jgi:hypothetical protein
MRVFITGTSEVIGVPFPCDSKSYRLSKVNMSIIESAPFRLSVVHKHTLRQTLKASRTTMPFFTYVQHVGCHF